MSLNLPRSVITAALILLAIVAYFGVRGIMRDRAPAPVAEETGTMQRVDTVPEVVVRAISTQPHVMYASLKGRTVPDRAVTVRSETTGTVVSAGLAEGSPVTAGTTLCALDLEARTARLAEAQAAVTARRVDYQAASDLAEKGWASPNNAISARAALDSAEAALDTIKIEISKTRLRAPFAGVFETRLAEAGDFLSPGAACGTVVDLDPIVVALEATEGQAQAITVGAPARINLADGRTLVGKIRFVARSADAQTRTFRVEAEAPNPDSAIPAGLTAAVQIATDEVPATLLSPALLVLHDDGRVGVRYVDSDDTVQFVAVTIADDASEGIWVTGLPDNARILAAGQDYLREGIRVAPVDAGEL